MIDGKRMQESEGTKFRIKNEAKQKSSERQMWVENKSGGGDCPKSQTFLSENRESDSGLV